MGERFFWYRLTRVVPDKGPLKLLLCVVVVSDSRESCKSNNNVKQKQQNQDRRKLKKRMQKSENKIVTSYQTPRKLILPTARLVSCRFKSKICTNFFDTVFWLLTINNL